MSRHHGIKRFEYGTLTRRVSYHFTCFCSLMSKQLPQWMSCFPCFLGKLGKPRSNSKGSKKEAKTWISEYDFGCSTTESKETSGNYDIPWWVRGEESILIFFSLLIHHCMVIVKTLTKVRLRLVSNVGDEWESGRSARFARDSGDRRHVGSSIFCAPRVSRNVGLIVSLQCSFHTYQLDTNFWCFSSPPTRCDSFFENLALELFFC